MRQFPALCIPDTAPVPFEDGDAKDLKERDILDQMFEDVKAAAKNPEPRHEFFLNIVSTFTPCNYTL
jgi:hypothetical protein